MAETREDLVQVAVINANAIAKRGLTQVRRARSPAQEKT